MARDIRDIVLACSICARGKTSNRPQEGLLKPLSVPSRPWSHIVHIVHREKKKHDVGPGSRRNRQRFK